MSLSSLCQPCNKDSNAGGVPCEVAGNLCSPVGGKEEVVSGSFAAAYDDGIAIYGRIEAIGESV